MKSYRLGAVGAFHAVRDGLVSAGIRTTGDLLRRASSQEQRESLARRLAVPVETMGRLVSIADLLRIASVGPETATTLVEAGVDGVQGLRGIPEGQLVSTLSDRGMRVGVRQVRKWQDESRKALLATEWRSEREELRAMYRSNSQLWLFAILGFAGLVYGLLGGILSALWFAATRLVHEHAFPPDVAAALERVVRTYTTGIIPTLSPVFAALVLTAVLSVLACECVERWGNRVLGKRYGPEYNSLILFLSARSTRTSWRIGAAGFVTVACLYGGAAAAMMSGASLSWWPDTQAGEASALLLIAGVAIAVLCVLGVRETRKGLRSYFPAGMGLLTAVVQKFALSVATILVVVPISTVILVPTAVDFSVGMYARGAAENQRVAIEELERRTDQATSLDEYDRDWISELRDSLSGRTPVLGLLDQYKRLFEGVGSVLALVAVVPALVLITSLYLLVRRSWWRSALTGVIALGCALAPFALDRALAGTQAYAQLKWVSVAVTMLVSVLFLFVPVPTLVDGEAANGAERD